MKTSITAGTIPMTQEPTSTTQGPTATTGGSTATTSGYAITTSISKGAKNIPLTSEQTKKFKIGQRIIIGTPPNTEVRTIVGFGN